MERPLQEIQARGCEARFVSIRRLGGLKNEIESRHEQGMFNPEFYLERLIRFEFQPPADTPEA